MDRKGHASVKKSAGTQETVSELRKRQLEVRKTFETIADRDVAQRRFEVKEKMGGTVISMEAPEKPVVKKEDKTPEKQPETKEESYLDRLKRAKQKAREDLEE
jgi:hypothetical protein